MRDQRQDPDSTTRLVAGRLDTATDRLPARRPAPPRQPDPARVPAPADPAGPTVAAPVVPAGRAPVPAPAVPTARAPQVPAPARTSPASAAGRAAGPRVGAPPARSGVPAGGPPARPAAAPAGHPARPEPDPAAPARLPVPEIPAQRTRPPAPVRRRRRLRPALLAVAAVVAAGGATWGVLAVTAPEPVPAPVVGAPVVLVHAAALDEAALRYRDVVVAEADALRDRTAELVAAVRAGRVALARDRYPLARAHWERIQVATEAVTGPDGEELGAAIDGQGVGLEPGEEFTGFHRLERDLWADGLQPDTRAIADRLLADVTALADGAPALQLTGHDLCTSAKELVDFAVVTALSGRENRFAGTDVADLAARVEGSRAAVEPLRPLLTDVDPALLAALDRRFADAADVLDRFRTGGT